MVKFDKNNIWMILTLIILIIGIVLRTCGLLQGHSFYLDEGDLIVNFRLFSYLGLFGPIYFDIQAPPMFLVMGKFLYSTFGYNEILLRSVIYFSGCLSLVLFFTLCKKVFKSNFSVFYAMLFLSLSYNLIYYSQAFKQYTIEMMFAIIATILFLNLDIEKLNRKDSLRLGIISAVSFWFSYSLAFVLSGFACVYLAKAIFEKSIYKIKNFLTYLLPIGIAFWIYYITNLQFVVGNKNLYTFWDRFTGFFPTSLAPINYIWGSNKYVVISVCILLIIGVVRFYLEDKFKLAVIASPILMTLVASALHLYPFGTRLIIFLFPFFFILIAKPFDHISIKNKTYSIFVLILFLMSMKYFQYKEYAHIAFNKNSYKQSTAREFINNLKKSDIKNNEYLYVGVDANGSINSYDEKNEIIDKVFIKERIIYEPKFSLKTSLNRIPKDVIIYFYLSDYMWCSDYSSQIMPWIEENCTILNRIDEEAGTFIKCKTHK